MARHRTLLCTAVLTALLAAPLAAQGGARRIQDWQYRWYWGLKGGMATYTLPTVGGVVTPQLGGDWLITERRAALYLGYSQTFQAERDTFTINGLGGAQDIAFDGMRRIQIMVVAMIGNGSLQPYAGGGFSIHQLSNATFATGGASTVQQQAIDDAATGAFLTGLLGVQYRMGSKLALFASWQFTPQGKDFMLQGGNNNFEGGVRYALMASREDPTTRNR